MPESGFKPGDIAFRYRKLVAAAPRIVATVATNFFKRNFELQGFPSGAGLDRWPARKAGAKRNSRRALLIDTGALRRSIRPIVIGTRHVIVGSSLPYARGHNEGMDTTMNVTVRSHQRGAHTRRSAGGKRRTVRVSAHGVSSFTRMQRIRLPRRQFIGATPALDRAITREFTRRINAL